MTAADFPEFVRAIHGPDKTPFLWQTRLCLEVAENQRWPATISVPTGCGKTSVLDIAVFCLALQGPLLRTLAAHERWARVRTVFCVDRRLVVDEAFDRAKQIAAELADSEEPILKEAAANLRLYGGRQPLKVARLRGGMYLDNTWADHPNQPLIVLSTVDQVGSRLLFRGYQVSDSQKPIHAGLMGLNSLVIVDEAHLSGAFLDTLSQVQTVQGAKDAQLAPSLQLVQMSATPLTDRASHFVLLPSEQAEPKIDERLRAIKRASLEEANESAFAARAAERAKSLAKNARVVGVVVNQVRTARVIFELLAKENEREAILLTGRIRPYDRDNLINEYLNDIRVEAKSQRKLYVVATQTVEVGANIDFDAMVTETAPLASLRQRFGRLHRLGNGERGPGQAVIIHRKTRQDSDPVYGPALQRTWTWLTERAQENTAKDIDFGFLTLDSLAPPDSLNPDPKPTLSLLPAHLEAWCQTNPRPYPDPDVAPFLHSQDSSPDVQVVWRSDLMEEAANPQRQWCDAVGQVPPKTPEALPVPLWAVRRWLSGVSPADSSRISDQEGEEGNSEEQSERVRPFVLWRSPEDCRYAESARLVRPGDTIVVPTSYGGCDKFGWKPESTEPVRDVGNDVSLAAPGRGWIRIWPPALASRRDSAQALLTEFRTAVQDDVSRTEQEEIVGRIKELIADVYENFDTSLLAASPSWVPQPGLLLFAKRQAKRSRNRVEVRYDQTDSEDDSSSLMNGRVALNDHTEHVVEKASEIAEACGVSPGLISDFLLSARLHDLGKADPRFQRILHDGFNGQTELLAKSGRVLSPAQYRRIADRAGYPEGCRHEFLSVALAKLSRALKSANDSQLVLHLIGTHHGRGRALAPVSVDSTPEHVVVAFAEEQLSCSSAHGLERLDSGWSEQFEALNKKYGRWGLAYLEALFRRADCLASEEEEAANSA